MLKLPLCPYCHAIYHYKTVRETTKEKEQICHNCQKKFTVSYKKGRAVLILAAALVLIVLNILLLTIFENITIWVCLAVTVLLVLLVTLLFPYTVRYKKTENTDNKKKNKRA